MTRSAGDWCATQQLCDCNGQETESGTTGDAGPLSSSNRRAVWFMKSRLMGVTTTALFARAQSESFTFAALQLADRPSKARLSLPRKQVSAPARFRIASAACRPWKTACSRGMDLGPPMTAAWDARPAERAAPAKTTPTTHWPAEGFHGTRIGRTPRRPGNEGIIRITQD